MSISESSRSSEEKTGGCRRINLGRAEVTYFIFLDLMLIPQ